MPPAALESVPSQSPLDLTDPATPPPGNLPRESPTGNVPRRRVARIVASIASASLALTALVGATAPTVASADPAVQVTKVVGGLTIPWDLTWVGDVMVYDQRAGSLWTKRGSAAPQRLQLALPRVFAQGEAGVLGIVADPKAAKNRYFYVCMAVRSAAGGPQDVEVIKWRLDTDTRATKVQTLIKGIPLKQGRHSGCRLRFRSSTMLYVGTGDTAEGSVPQNLNSLGGKVLRVRSDGTIPRANPFYRRGGNARYVWTYGHRNIQGLAKRPGKNEMWSVEHGTNRDDEINRIYKGGNYGWDPIPGYNESRPMTDKRRFPSARSAKWSSGYPTVATSGATFLSGRQWGSWNGRLAVAMLKGQGIRLVTLSGDRVVGSQTRFTSFGRIRTVQQGPDGALYFTTSNGNGGDGIYRVTAR